GRRLQGVPEHRMSDVARGYARPVERVLRRHGAKLGRRQLLERTAEAAESGAHAGQEDDVCIGTLGLHEGSSALVRGISGGWGEGGRARRIPGLRAWARRCVRPIVIPRAESPGSAGSAPCKGARGPSAPSQGAEKRTHTCVLVCPRAESPGSALLSAL